MKKTRRIIPLLLAIVMVVSMMQVTAFAATDEPDMIQLEEQSGRSYSISQGTIKLFCPYEGYEGTEVIHSGTTWYFGNYREITWSITDGVGTLTFRGSYTLVNAIQFDGGNGLANVVIELDGSDIRLIPGASALAGINEEYLTEFGIQVNDANLKIVGIPHENYENSFSIKNETGFSEESPDEIYTVMVNNGDFTVEGAIDFRSVSVITNQSTSSGTNIYVPNGNVTIGKEVWACIQSTASNAVGYNIYTRKTVTLSGECHVVSYQDFNPASINITASELKIGDGKITIETEESVAAPYTVEPTLLDNEEHYKVDTIQTDTGTKLIYTYTGTGIPDDVYKDDNQKDIPFPFTDVLSTDWFYDAVKYLYEHGVTNGTSDTTFSPNMELTRGQFITLIMRAYKVDPDENPVDNFSDAGDTYYTGYLAAAKRLGIADGIGNNMFAPERSLTRQEMCKLLYNLLKMLDKLPENTGVNDVATFPDYNEIADWGMEGMSHCVGAGIIVGSDGKLMPNGTTTRAQMAQVLYRLLTK